MPPVLNWDFNIFFRTNKLLLIQYYKTKKTIYTYACLSFYGSKFSPVNKIFFILNCNVLV